ncbi:GtrA family protein [Mucilaginibacter pallidiroseus]|uniref:GtrA family protein n=1 Tax=Mucilaginibacter pallidiroseus TaxID=2599295 RepID=A0A563UI88_9SPHI|nr:GtrA family protein [Mucilaginibacter pallidiroseus]TWR30999.1 GtrA family protein [Mucilaginibacter pallidiroseus]
MATFVKAQASSLIASALDFLTTIVCKEIFHVWYVAANLIGTVVGGIANFMLGRVWVFHGESKGMPKQILKYVIVWGGNAFLNTSGVFLVTHYFGLSYIISKVVVSLIVGVTYNYFLQKKFVFA